MNSLLYKLLKRTDNTIISFSVTLINLSQIRIGNNCYIDPYCYLKAEGADGKLSIRSNVVIKRYSHISAKGSNVEIKAFSYIGYNNWVGGCGNITVGRNFISGMNVVIISSNHDYQNIIIPYYKGEEISESISIGDNVWVGANSVILPGVSIGDGAVIGAGSIVTEDVPQNAIMAGNPAKVIQRLQQNRLATAT